MVIDPDYARDLERGLPARAQVMVDASDQPLPENIRRTRELVAMAHACGVPVEGELGYVPGVEGEDAARHPGKVTYTSPDGCVEIAVRFNQRLFALHHACAGALAQLLNHGCRYSHYLSSAFFSAGLSSAFLAAPLSSLPLPPALNS